VSLVSSITLAGSCAMRLHMGVSSVLAPDGSILTDLDRGFAEIALSAAEQAGETLSQRFSEPARQVQAKDGPVDLVSDADREAEDLIVGCLRDVRPNDAITSEERLPISGSSGFEWLIDPLDGTHNFIRGIPLWCVSVAVADEHGPRVAVIYDPVHEERFFAVRGHGSMLNGRRMAPRRGRTDPEQRILGGSCRRAVPPGSARAERLAAFVAMFANTRELLAGALELAWMSAGRFDVLYHESKITRLDASAGMLLCREAGLAVHSLPPPPDGRRGRLLVCPPSLAPMLLETIS
jgi:myo-inositol-1(or 4)-monophosphatase